jgi:NADPH:quinone reductase-like Zn-dependent oxidoreductase
MKAAVLYKVGTAPKYADFTDPVPYEDRQELITVKAAAVKNLDKGIASGAHYASDHAEEAKVVGIDGAGITHDGTRVYAMGASGMIAEKAVADKNKIVKLPAGLDFVTAAALPNAVMGAAAAMHFRAGLKSGETILINGATGVTGMVAVQIARHYGAKKIIVTGRNPESLKKLQELGADEVISLKKDDEQIINALKEINKKSPINVVIDYTWGHPAELILGALQGKGANAHKLRFVTVGGMAGDKVQLSSSWLRSTDIQISGSGLGSLPPEAMQELFTTLVPEMFELAAAGKLRIETVTAKLRDIEATWNQDVPAGKRLVIVME